MKARPPSGHRFEAVMVQPHGWMVLAPWIQNEHGYWYRPNIDVGGRYVDSQEWAERVAAEINKAMGGGQS